jgi:hypothetical protein
MKGTFSTEVKNELSRVYPTKICCRKAELSAILRINGSLHIKSGSSYALHTVTENAATARLIVSWLKELFCLEINLTVRRSRLHKNSNYLIFIPDQPGLNQALNELGILDDKLGVTSTVLPRLVRKKCCALAYLRGAFLGGGFISNPKSNYHFEITTDNAMLAEGLQALLHRNQLTARINIRKRYFAVYLKNSDQIVRFLALVGAHKALLGWEDVRVVKEIRGQVNRLVNCDTANLNKAVKAALNQLEDIKVIEKEIGFRNLNRGLREFAQVRIRYPDVCLRELGQLMRPKLSKSAVAHRARRINKIADSIRASLAERKEGQKVNSN